jgi:pimeloyl-ACP methyl ester carboxylesterase
MIEAFDLQLGERSSTGLACGPDDGELVVLLHGFPQTSHAWRMQLEALGDAGFRAVAPDMRGFSDGARVTNVAEYALETAVSDVVEIAAALGRDRFHLAGHDLGGIVAWELACRHPESVRTLAVASTPHLVLFSAALHAGAEGVRIPPFELFRQPRVAEELLLADGASVLRQAYAGLSGDAIDEYVRVFTAPGVLSAALAYFRAFDFDDWLRLPPSPVPTLFMWGTEDPFLDPSTAAATREHVTGTYKEVALDGVGHWVPELAAETVSELLAGHISGFA